MELVSLKDYNQELALLIDDDIRHNDGYKISTFNDSYNLLNDCISIIDSDRGFFWGILIDGKLAGFFGYYTQPNDNNEYYFLTRTYLLKNYRSSGLNKKIKTIISNTFNHYQAPLYAKIHKDNKRSIIATIRSQGIFQYYDNNLIVFLLSYGNYIPEKQVINIVNRIKNKIYNTILEPVA